MNKLVLIFCVIPSICFALNISLLGKTKEIKKKVVLEDYSQIVGPGIIKLKSSSEGFFFKGKNILIDNVTFIVEDNTQKRNSLFHLLDGANNISIRNSTFNGARYSILKSDINSKKDKDLLFKNRVKELKFINNLCFGSYSRHLLLSSLENVKITGNTFKNSVRDSIRIRQNVKRVTISGNTFKNIGVKSKESSDAIDTFWSGEELIISNNHFSTISTHALDIKGISPDTKSKSSKVIISDNIFSDIQFSGILISSGAIVKNKVNKVDNFIIKGNQFYNINLNAKNKNDSPIFLRHGVKDVIISSNIIDANNSHGIVLGNFEQNAAQTSGVLILSNIIKAKGNPVFVHASRDVIVKSNNFFGKKVKVIKSYKKFLGDQISISDNL